MDGRRVSSLAPLWPAELKPTATRLSRPARPAGGASAEPSLTELLSLADWSRFVPETLGLLAIILFIRAALPPTFHTPVGMPDSFWIPVLLISVHYGIMGGLFATIAATAAFAIGGLPPGSASEDFYAYAAVVAAQPCAWFATALILGGLRTLHIHHHNVLQGQLDRAELAADDLARGVEEAVAEIHRLELRIGSESDTLASLLHSLSKLDVSSRNAVGDSVCDFIGHGVGATSFALFLLGADGLEPCMGVEDGSRIALTAIPPLTPTLLGEIGQATTQGGQGPARADGISAPLWAPMRLPCSSMLFGIVVCHRLHPLRDTAFASRRLEQVCGVLATLLAASPSASARVDGA